MLNKTKKITFATVKSFVNKNRKSLFINVTSDFNGMTDCVESLDGGFREATPTAKSGRNEESLSQSTLGIEGAWFVGSSRDHLSPYKDNTYTGYKVSNSCGSFILAIKKVAGAIYAGEGTPNADLGLLTDNQ